MDAKTETQRLRKTRRRLGGCWWEEHDGSPSPTPMTCIQRRYAEEDMCARCQFDAALARMRDAIVVAITNDDGLDGAVGERILRDYGWWPPVAKVD